MATKKSPPPPDLRKLLIDDMVKRLRDYGYPHCDADNVVTDQIYSAFFRESLKETVADKRCFDDMRKACDALLEEIASAEKARQ